MSRRSEAEVRLESLRIYAGQIEDGDRGRDATEAECAIVLSTLLAGDAICTALLAVADEIRVAGGHRVEDVIT